MSQAYTPQDYCRPEILDIQPYQPGKPIAETQRETGVDEIIKLASNENLLGPSPLAVAAIKQCAEEVLWYPESQDSELKQALAERHQIVPECITIGNGSNEILELIGRCFLHAGTAAVYSEYAFAVYELTTRSCGAISRIASANKSDSSMPYGHNLDLIREQITADTRVVFIANPNNPTGTWLEKETIKTFLSKIPLSVIVVVDQAYIEYTEDCFDIVPCLKEYPNLVVTQTFSKLFALAGLRIGYALSSPEIADLLNRIRQPFNVNCIAPKAALAALKDRKHIQQSIQTNRAGLEELREGCADLGLETLPSAANFICIKIDAAEQIYQRLLRQGIIVRPVTNYGLPDYLRVTVGMSEHNQKFLAALHAVRKSI